MFNPIERGRQLREQRQRTKEGCGFCGFADKQPEPQLYHDVTHNPHFADNLRTFADKPADNANIAANGNTAEKIRNLSAIHPQLAKPITTGFPANPQNPQRGESAENPHAADKSATAADVETILANLRTVGHDLGLVEALARDAMAQLTRQAAAELAVVLDDAFAMAPDNATARAHCRRLLNDPQALAAAKAVWPDLPPPLAAIPQATTTARVVDHAPQWLRLIRQHCALVPEDERLLNRCLGMQPPRDALQAAQRYASTWQQAARAEPRQAARDNAGRRAANNELRGGSRHAG